MNKKELIVKVARDTGVSQEVAKKVIESAINVAKNEVAAGEEISIVGFGSLYATKEQTRKGYNFKTGKTETFTSSKSVRFKPSKVFKVMVNENW